MAIKNVGIVYKRNVPEARRLAIEAAGYLKERGIRAIVNGRTSKEAMVRHCDLMLVLGGDGTFLSVARRMVARSVPILGVNMGQLGFLAEVKKTELFAALAAALKRKVAVCERRMLECTLTRKGRRLLRMPIVNDVVVSRGAIARIFDMTVLVDGKLATDIRADGLIVSSPTGSTAYSLAAGGPIVVPEVPAMAITPVCPHSLTLRPLIIPDTSEVTVVPRHKDGTVILTLDGQTSVKLRAGDLVKVTRYEKHPLRIIRLPRRDYYSLLREKLKYGYRD